MKIIAVRLEDAQVAFLLAQAQPQAEDGRQTTGLSAALRQLIDKARQVSLAEAMDCKQIVSKP